MLFNFYLKLSFNDNLKFCKLIGITLNLSTDFGRIDILPLLSFFTREHPISPLA